MYLVGFSLFACLPDNPDTSGNDPMCIDAEWFALIEAWINKKPYSASGYGMGYMLVGSAPESNTDPYAEGPTDDNERMSESVPHFMMIVPDPSSLDGMNSDPWSGTPWVMWRGHEHAHIMMPMPARQDCA